MSGTSAAPMSLRTRMVPLVLLLFITSTIPLSPAVDATSSRNLQDFQIVAPVEPFINGSYDLWETQSLIVDVRNNASTPIGGRQLQVSVCAGDHTAGNACPSQASGFPKTLFLPTLQPDEIYTAEFSGGIYTGNLQNQTYTVIYEFSSADIRPENDRISYLFHRVTPLKDIVYLSNNADTTYNSGTEYSLSATASTGQFTPGDQAELGWTLSQIDAQVGEQNDCVRIGSGDQLPDTGATPDDAPPYISTEVTSSNDWINLSVNTTGLQIGETYAIVWEARHNNVINSTNSGSLEWMASSSEENFSLEFEGLDDGVHCITTKIIIPILFIEDQSNAIQINGYSTSTAFDAAPITFPNTGRFSIEFWFNSPHDPNAWNDRSAPFEVIVSDDVDITILSVLPARGDETVVQIGFENYALYPYGDDSLEVKFRNDGDMVWNSTLSLEVLDSLDSSGIQGYPVTCTRMLMPQAVGTCVFNLPIIGQYIVNASATGGPTEVDPENNYLETQITVNQTVSGAYVAVPAIDGMLFETGEAIQLVAGLAPNAPLPANYTWKIDYTEVIAQGRVANVTLPMGNHIVTLHVRHGLMDESDFDEVGIRHIRVLNRINFDALPIITEGEAVSVEEMEFELLGTAFPPTVVHAAASNIGKTPLRSLDYRLVPTDGDVLNVDYIDIWGNISQLIPSSVDPSSVQAMHIIDGPAGILAPLIEGESFESYGTNNSFHLRTLSGANISMMLIGDMAPVNVTPMNFRTQQLEGGQIELMWESEGPINDPYFGGWKVYKRSEFPFRWPYDSESDFENTVSQNWVTDLPGGATSWLDPNPLPSGICASYILAAVDHQGEVDYTHGNVTGWQEVGNPDLQCGDSIAPGAEMLDVRAVLTYNSTSDVHTVTVTWTYPELPDQDEDGVPDGGNITWSLYRTQNIPEAVTHLNPIMTGMSGEAYSTGTFIEEQASGVDGLSIGQNYHYILVPSDSVGNTDGLVRDDNVASIHITDMFWEANPHLIPEELIPDKNHENDWVNSLLSEINDPNFQTAAIVAIAVIAINMVAVPVVINRNRKIRRRLKFLLEKGRGTSANDEEDELSEFFG